MCNLLNHLIKVGASAPDGELSTSMSILSVLSMYTATHFFTILMMRHWYCDGQRKVYPINYDLTAAVRHTSPFSEILVLDMRKKMLSSPAERILYTLNS